MADIDALTLDVEDMLYGVPQIERPVEDTLATEVTNLADVEWRWTTEPLHKRGGYWELLTSDGSIGEVVLDTEDHPAGADTTVRRSQQRTTGGAGAIAAGTVFRKNPVFTRVKIQKYLNEIIDGLYPDVWIRTLRSLDVNVGRFYYPLTAADYEVEDVHQADIASTSLGDATFDFTGGASEDLWTLASHGLTVGDPVRFTVAGTGADEYAVNVVYWVATVPDANTFQLSATQSTTVLEGTADSIGTWTIESIIFEFFKYPRDGWSITTAVDGRTSPTNRVLHVKWFYSTDSTLFYSAKTKPSSSSVSDIPTAMADWIPYGAVWLLMGGTRTVPSRIDPLRSIPPQMSPSQPMADSRFFRDEFEKRKEEYRNQLNADKFLMNYLRRNAVPRRVGTGRPW